MRSSTIAITGIGAVTAAGHGVDSLWHSIEAGVSHIRKISSFDASMFPTQIAAEVRDLQLDKYLPLKLIKRTGRATQLALIAAHEAISDSKLDLSNVDLERTSVVVGVSSPQLDIGEQSFSYLFEGGLNRLPPTSLGAFFPNATAGALTSLFRIKGPSLTISTGCSAGSNAIGQAMRMIQNNVVDRVIVVGTDCPITPFGLASFCALKNMSTQNDSPESACRPFDQTRDGFVLGEGAGALVLEKVGPLQDLVKSRPYCHVTAYSCTSSVDEIGNGIAFDNGLSRAIQLSLKEANLKPESISAINAHACGSRLFDRYEAMNICDVFGVGPAAPRVFSIKPIVGHPLAASGPLQAVATALCIQHKRIPPVVNFTSGDPIHSLNVSSRETSTLEDGANILLNDCGYGGNNVSLIMKGYPD